MTRESPNQLSKRFYRTQHVLVRRRQELPSAAKNWQYDVDADANANANTNARALLSSRPDRWIPVCAVPCLVPRWAIPSGEALAWQTDWTAGTAEFVPDPRPCQKVFTRP